MAAAASPLVCNQHGGCAHQCGIKPTLNHCKACKTEVANASRQGFVFRKPTLLTTIRLNFSLFYSIISLFPPG
jgi:hypothetical protein